MDMDQQSLRDEALQQFGLIYLEKRGWFESLDGIPRNHQGSVPWITYPAFRQLQRIVRPGSRVFEYGCGSSSLWWASHAATVISVEHDAGWAAHVAAAAPPNLKIVARPIGAPCAKARHRAVAGFFADPPELPVAPQPQDNIIHGLACEEFVAYATEITEYPRKSFDVVVVDGMARALTAWLAARWVKPDGVIVFDNADRHQYNGAFRLLDEAGFRRIDYYGPGPVNRREWCTSLFVKDFDIFRRSVETPPGEGDLKW